MYTPIKARWLVRKLIIAIGLLLPCAGAWTQDLPLPPVSTYSIVARDPATGDLGVAVQSHYFSVGSVVPWAEAGVGAVATQSFAEPSYGPLGLTLMRTGRSATEALAALVSTDTGKEVRQVAMIDARGEVAAHTGARTIAYAGHQLGHQFSVQANLMERATVWPAMATAFETTKGDLAERLLAALEAAEEQGGDIRGRQSAALLIVSGESSGRPWDNRIFDLRVEDHSEPITELRRLVELQRTYNKLAQARDWLDAQDAARYVAAMKEVLSSAEDQDRNGEIAFWTGIGMAGEGAVDEAIVLLRRAYRANPRWADLLTRLPAAGLLAADPSLIDTLTKAMQQAP